MANTEDKKKNKINKIDENDPFNFFKFPNEQDKKNKKSVKPDNNKRPSLIVILLVGVTIILILELISSFFKNEGFIDYSNFRTLVENGTIVDVEINDNYVVGYEKVPVIQANKSKQKGIRLFELANQQEQRGRAYKSKINILVVPELTALLNEKNISYEFVIKESNGFFSFIISLLFPFGLIFLFYFIMMKKMGGGAGGGMSSIFNVGSSRAKVVEEGKTKTRFSDVAGVDEAKDELVEVVDFLKSPKKYTDIGGKIPKGVLLVGPPGTGKTLLARAVAGEAGVPFFRISGSDFVEMFVGVGASRVRDLFKQAREKAPCIIFIDELDAIGKSRVNNLGGNDEREQTLNQLLVEMDGFDNEKGLIILGATNRADILDPALLRPGRFDRQVPVERPDVKGREAILRIHAKPVKLDDDVDFDSVAHGTTGFSGADLANVVNEAALLAVRNNRKKVTMIDFNDAIDKVSIGLKKKTRSENEVERKIVAFHETGHALMGAFTPNYPPVNKITVVPRSNGVGGFTQYREQEEKSLKTKTDLINEVDVLLGGRAAEQVIFKEISTGASNDISRATDIVKSMITDFGMSEKFQNMTLGKGVRGYAGGEPELIREFSEETQKYIDEEIARIINERYQHAIKTLKKHKELLDVIANKLLENETIDGKEFSQIVKAEEHCALLVDGKD